MDEEEILVLLKGEDKTKDIEQIEEKEKAEVKFYRMDKIYSYGFDKIIIRRNPIIIDLREHDIYYKNQILFNIKKAIRFEEFVKVVYDNQQTEIFEYINISIKSNKSNNINKNVIKYFKEIAKFVKNTDEDTKEKEGKFSDESFLYSQYKKIKYINKSSVLNHYINKINLVIREEREKNLIYPFRFNKSQREALENIYKSNISVIEGPPGTGKTQTILNIIANLSIMQNKTVAVVSNNNEAVKNVKDKLEKNGYGFIIADLGKKKKREHFFDKLPQPNLDNLYNCENDEYLLNRIQELDIELNELLEKSNKQAQLEKDITNYKLEQKYFKEHYKNQKNKIHELKFYENTSSKLLEVMIDGQLIQERKTRFLMLYKLKFSLKYGFKKFKSLKKYPIETLLSLENTFYNLKIKELEDELFKVKMELKQCDFKKLQNEHQNISKKIFENKLYNKYLGKENVFGFSNYKNDMKKFINAFPVILSTTYSLRNSIHENFMFDYVIIDEASQVDLLSGCLALSCAKNAIIVGDTKQLPQIVEMNIKEKISDDNVDVCHDYFQNSILSAILRTYGDNVPQKTLKEHYRCHPKIIEFCNKRYYNDELIAFATNEHKMVDKPLILYYTSEGNHMRKITRGDRTGTFNERENEVIKELVLKDDRIKKYKNEDVGITTPYRMQADNMQKDIEKDIESDTIHKFQGREKKLMILSTVIDNSYLGKKGIKFVDDACMVNVAVSRAINQFVVVTDKTLFNTEGKEIKSLLKYIKYNELDSEIINSQIVSVFDLLYKNYSEKLESLNKRLLNRSKFKSEDIIDTILDEGFIQKEFIDYEYRREILLRNCLNDIKFLSLEEQEYVKNGARVDFIVYDKMDKKPKLFIEVDGFEFHLNRPEQLKKDKLKNNIARKSNIPMLRLETARKSYTEEEIIEMVKEKLGIS